jgi:hypothetical protein
LIGKPTRSLKVISICYGKPERCQCLRAPALVDDRRYKVLGSVKIAALG